MNTSHLFNIYYLKKLVICFFLLACLGDCEQKGSNQTSNNSDMQASFQGQLNGKKIGLYQLSNGDNIQVTITNYGGRIVHFLVPDRDDNLRDIVLGYNSLNGYLDSKEPYFGALIGRFGNRIANAQFELNDTGYRLNQNNGINNLHGGPNGFHNVVWDVKAHSNRKVTLSYLSPDGEEGFPGNLEVEVSYILTEENELIMEYQATTDQSTPVNLTNHAFFNLDGDASGTINNHILQIQASHFTPVDQDLIPTGDIVPVAGTPFDFTTPTAIKTQIGETNEQLEYGKGYDHNFVLDKGITKTRQLAAIIKSPASGIELQVLTTEPGLQFYGGNFLDGSDTGKNGKYEYRGAFCLETQHFPDSPNQPDFPNVILSPGEKYQTSTTYKISVNNNC